MLEQSYGGFFIKLPEPELLAHFFTTPLGRLYLAIPFGALAKTIPKPKGELSGKGCKPFFDVRGGMALQVLKAYYSCSDAKLIELVNGNWQMQLFCGVQLSPGKSIRDQDLVGRWRRYLSHYLGIDQLQLICAAFWKPWMRHPHLGLCDATVFESYIAYPTDASLLWKSCCDVYGFIQKIRKQAGLRKSRIRHDKRKQHYLAFSFVKKKSYRKNKATCLLLLRYLQRLLLALEQLMNRYASALLSTAQQQKLNTIKALYEQQQQIHLRGEKVQSRIVALHKPYVRPIVRGKQTKHVEFGCKVHLLQIDGINFIEHLSYENFNEGTRLKSTLELQHRYGSVCHQLGADRIYATNANRRYCSRHQIATSFVPKGKQGKEKEQKATMRSVLSKVRGTHLEGSFGNEKNHYCLDQIKARNEATEKVWIFFSILASNAVQIARRMHEEGQSKKRASLNDHLCLQHLYRPLYALLGNKPSGASKLLSLEQNRV
jgi:transposase, IS5 family